MSDLISRESVLREFTCLADDAFVINRKIQEIVKKLPSVKPEQKSGKWIDKGIVGNDFMCSECGWHAPCFPERISELHYCANCGARMEVDA